MDVVTHAVLGATLAHATGSRGSRMQLRERLLLGGFAAAFPDIDFVGFLIDPLAFLADWHQGPTHSLVLLPLWSLGIAGVFTRWASRQGVFREAFALAALALGSHIVSDLITVYGTALLYPLSAARWSMGTTFVIDPLFTAILGSGLALALWTRRRSIALVALLALGLYVAAQDGLRQQALQAGRSSARAHGLALSQLSALPQPFSPFNWKVIGSDGERYHQAYLKLAGDSPWVPALPGLRTLHDIAAAYRPAPELQWQARPRLGENDSQRALVEFLWNDPRLAQFRRFAAFPSLSRVDAGDPPCVWFTDLRYDLPALPDTFRYGFCKDGAEGTWELYRLRYFSKAARQPLH